MCSCARVTPHMYAWIHVCLYMYMYMYVYVCIKNACGAVSEVRCTCMYVCMYVCNVFVNVHICMYTKCMWSRVHIDRDMCSCLYVCMNTYINVYIFMYI